MFRGIFNIPQPQHEIVWKLLFAPQGFAGQFDPTTAERRNPRFGYQVRHECLWNGPSWPFATTQTLVALANLLNGPQQDVVNESDYFHLLRTSADSQRIQTPRGKVIPWIDEDLNADTGAWSARSVLIAQHALPKNRGRYYNHSGFADLIITGLIGVRPEPGGSFTLHPLIPAGMWDYFVLDGLPYHGHVLTIVYDRDGSAIAEAPGCRFSATVNSLRTALRSKNSGLRYLSENDSIIVGTKSNYLLLRGLTGAGTYAS